MTLIVDYLRSLNLISILVLVATIVFTTVALYLVFSSKLRVWAKLLIYIALNLLYFFVSISFFSYGWITHLLYLVPSTILAFFLSLITKKGDREKNKKHPVWWMQFSMDKGKVIIDNLKRGVVIFGAAGSGKTESVFAQIINHYASKKVPILVYDYKDLELTELVNFYYRNADLPIYTLIPHEPTLTNRFNPFKPELVSTIEQLENQVNVLYNNLSDPHSKSTNPYFDDATKSALVGTLWRLKDDFPNYCTLPHAAALCLNSSAKNLAHFIYQNPIARMKGAAYLDAIAAKETLSNVKSTMSTKLNKIASPTVFWLLSGHDFDPRINNKDYPAVVNVVNNPKMDATYGPFVSLVLGTIIKSMQVRGQEPSSLVLDEATTAKISGLSKIPATMRSYNIATIIGTQDRAMANLSYNEKETDALLSNLSYQFVGKANENKSIKYYKEIAEEIEKKVISKSYKDSLVARGDDRKTESVRDTSKYKNQDFRSLKPGEFIFFSDGEDVKVKFKLIPFERIKPGVKHFMTQRDLDNHMQKVIDESLNLLEHDKKGS